MEFRYSFLLIAAIFTGFHHCQLQEMAQMFRTNKGIYCGKHLTNALATICKGNYNPLQKNRDSFQKKSIWDPEFGANIPTDALNLNYPYRTKAEATSMMSNYRRRRRRGVYNECCEKACSHDEMKSYCGDDRKRKRRWATQN